MRVKARSLIVFCVFIILFIFYFVVSTTSSNTNSNTDNNDEVTYMEPEQSLAPRILLHKPSKQHCQNRTLFVGVHVRSNSFYVRQEWRDSFGELKEKYNFCLVFGVGLPSEDSDLDKMEQESLVHGDLLFGDFMDTYKNLTHKQLMLLRYFNQELKEVPLFLKIDDDVAVNLEKLQPILSNVSQSIPTVLCHLWVQSWVYRKGHKSAISRKQWPPSKWPNFCSGMGYIINQMGATALLERIPYERWLHLDDVFITGVLAKGTKIKQVQMERVYGIHPYEIDEFLAGSKIFQLTHRNETKGVFEFVNKL